MKLKRLIIAAGVACLFVSTYSLAETECVMRSSSTLKVAGQIGDIAEIKPLLSPVVDGKRKCSISAKVAYKGNWYLIYGDYIGPVTIENEDLCINAVELAVRQFLASKEAKQFNTESLMVCSDEPVKSVHTVQIGDRVTASQILPDERNPALFTRQGTTCRYFIEVNPRPDGKDLEQWRGIVCKTGRPDLDEWTVISKIKGTQK